MDRKRRRSEYGDRYATRTPATEWERRWMRKGLRAASAVLTGGLVLLLAIHYAIVAGVILAIIIGGTAAFGFGFLVSRDLDFFGEIRGPS